VELPAEVQRDIQQIQDFRILIADRNGHKDLNMHPASEADDSVSVHGNQTHSSEKSASSTV